MKKLILLGVLLFSGIATSQKVYSVDHSYDADVNVYKVDHPYDAGWVNSSKKNLME